MRPPIWVCTTGKGRQTIDRGISLLTTQQQRLAWRSAFFALFILAPPLDIFRFDLTENHFILLWQPWVLGSEAFQQGLISPAEMAWNMFLRFFLPIGLIVGGGVFISWKWGRLYCGWLCPHFSVVEMINKLMRRASGKVTLWEKQALPERQQDGSGVTPHRAWWLLTMLAVVFFSFLWALALLTYLLPPAEIYGNLFSGDLSRNQTLFIGVATLVFSLEFTLARHLFCRYGCAIGLFQSLVWMGNKRSMVVAFDRKRSKLCADCDASCEHACPMRLNPRAIKRKMFTCTQCLQCIDACDKVQSDKSGVALLKLLDRQCALDVSARDFGERPQTPGECFDACNKGKRHCDGAD
jgi:polyferredoxin